MTTVELFPADIGKQKIRRGALDAGPDATSYRPKQPVRFAGARIDVRALSAQLQDEGAKSFANSWNDLMGAIGSKCAALKRASPPL